MRKIVLAIIVLLLAVPALATVRIDAIDEGGGVVRIDYTSDEPNKVIGFALLIDVNGANITDVNEYLKGESTASKRGYGIFLDPFGGVEIDLDGNLIGRLWGSSVSDSQQPGAAGTGIGTNKVIAEMGALHYPPGDTEANAPGDSGTLCWVTVSGNCSMSIIPEDTFRIGVTLSNGRSSADNGPPVDVNAPGYDGRPAFDIIFDKCFPGSPSGNTWPNWNEYDYWVAAGEPPCWCAKAFAEGYPKYGYQCKGDADGDFTGKDQLGKREWAGFNDYQILAALWQKKDNDPNFFNHPRAYCADLDHAFTGKDVDGKREWVGFGDWQVLAANWQLKDNDPNGDDMTVDCFGTAASSAPYKP